MRSAAPRSLLLMRSIAIGATLIVGSTTSSGLAAEKIDFNRDIRPILSNNCFTCHGPDESNREELRLDTEEGAFEADIIVRGQPDQSELIRRLETDDEDERMPPADTGKSLTAKEVALMKQWIRQGAPFSKHWSYEIPQRSEVPQVAAGRIARNAIDNFILDRLEREKIEPSPEADRTALIRRLALDLTGLPPTIEEVEQFLADKEPQAYERLVDRLLESDAYGEHWARLWLDMARYADSAGYADDPARTIWAFRDYAIKSFNDNKPFDQFTIEQIAGDLLENPTDEQLTATAFHRNTLTNNEGGTSDEEFRNVAIVDRVNTTMAVWMATTITCAQCHNHKYDPISQKEFFQLFAILNNTQDADRRNESPLLQLHSPDQLAKIDALKAESVGLRKLLTAAGDAKFAAGQAAWEKRFATAIDWKTLDPVELKSKSGSVLTRQDDRSVLVEKSAENDIYTIDLSLDDLVGDKRTLAALQIEPLSDVDFVVSRVSATITPPSGASLLGRYVRIELSGKNRILSLAEVQVMSGGKNVATSGAAKQSSTASSGPAKLAIDGNTDGRYERAKSTSHTSTTTDPWWEVDLKSTLPLDQISVWNRTDNNLQKRLDGFRIVVLDAERNAVWQKRVAKGPKTSETFPLSGARTLLLAGAYSDGSKPRFEAAGVLDEKNPNDRCWSIDSASDKSLALTLVPTQAAEIESGARLTLTIEQSSKHKGRTLRFFRIRATDNPLAAERAKTPLEIRELLGKEDEVDRLALAKYYVAKIAPELDTERKRLAAIDSELAAKRPDTSVPIMRAMAADKQRKTHIQVRGNFLVLGDEVNEGLPSAWHTVDGAEQPNRLTLAKWLVDKKNPMTPRVVVNRLWESLFGVGIVRTSEEFGSQGDAPSHAELLDWLAVELTEQDLDLKHMLRLMACSATYRQQSHVTAEMLEVDPDNRLLARGPRFRMSAEMIRDQALYVGGLLSRKMYGPPVRPPQPILGVSAAFGGGIDWVTSKGEDRYRRGLYTTWRRSNPYPSMATFDAPNREVCILRRDRTNTPLQALVTLNDPVYVEASQALGRRMSRHGESLQEKTRFGFRVCLSREPTEKELTRLTQLYGQAEKRFAADKDLATKMATDPLGPIPEGAEAADLAAWTVVANVLLNLDEMLMKR